ARVENYLRQNGGIKFIMGRRVEMGEVMAKAFFQGGLKGGTKDNTEAEIWRGVVVNVWNRDLPPPPPVGISTPFNDGTWATNASTVIDYVGLGLTLIDAGADIFEIVAVAGVTGPLGLIFGSIQGIAALPMLFHNSDAIANSNGRVQGEADAVQDMCDQFKDPNLRKVPMSQWPAVKVPTPHIPENPQPTANQDAWRGGQHTGLRIAVDEVLKLEQNPKPVTLPSGKHVKISGREWLFAASQNFKDNCGVKLVIEPVNAQLAKNGKRPWPTR
ncbi:MAG TPA: hypothetical protein VL133_00340, partial [Devosia sp.]|nr:hypothetical protein [Devosia sp.]